MEVNVSRASAVIVQRVPAEAEEWFLEWQGNVINAAKEFRGYRGTEVFPPKEGHNGQWVSLIHFEDDKALNEWLESPVRNEWLEKLRTKIGNFEIKKLTGGFGPWFAEGVSEKTAGPAAWKMVMSVVLGLFPTVMLLTIFVGPITSPLGLAVSMLIGNAMSVSILQWIVMPVLTRLLGPWLNAPDTRNKAITYGTPLIVLLALAILALLFRQVTG